jgi:hypothetical protein
MTAKKTTEAAAAFAKVAPAPPRATAAAKPRARKSVPKTMVTRTSPEGDAAIAEAMATSEEAAPAKKAPAKAGEPTISVWVGRKIAEMAKAQKRGSLGAKLRAVTPSKAGDHTVKLNRAEADKLRELAAKVEGESTGMMALSARTLQARIDFAGADAWGEK